MDTTEETPTVEPPTPVEVTNTEPLPVVIAEDPHGSMHAGGPQDIRAQTTAKTVAALAKTDADILRTDDQRRISGIWERTQQVIALAVVLEALVIVGFIIITPGLIALLRGEQPAEFAITAALAGMLFLTGVSNLVIGFYFGRTNHTRVGGVSAIGDEVTR